MSKHTQGPWAVDSNLPPNARTVVCRTCDGTPISANYEGPHPAGEDDANARLIAAARELLEACQTFLRVWHRAGPLGSAQFEKFDVVVHACKSAIAKAEGETP